MKKIFVFILAMTCTISLFAAINSQLTIYLDSESKEVEARIASGDNYDPFNAGACAAYFNTLSNASNIGMYLVYEGNNYMELYAPQFINIPVAIVTSREAASKQNYGFFAELGAAANNSVPVYMTDLRPDGGGAPVTFELNDATNYQFTLKNEAAYVEGTNSVIADRFVINYNPAVFVTSVTTNEDGWASFAYGSDIAPAYPSGLTIYKGALDITDPENPAINLTAVSAIPAGDGVFVKGAPLTEYHFAATSASPLASNDIRGCVSATPVSDFGTAAIYTLRNVGGVTALYHYEGTTDIPAGKAVLPISLGGAPAPKHVIMRIDGTQAVENISLEPVNSQKLIKNGQILIQRGDAVYNLQGQMVK